MIKKPRKKLTLSIDEEVYKEAIELIENLSRFVEKCFKNYIKFCTNGTKQALEKTNFKRKYGENGEKVTQADIDKLLKEIGDN